MIDCCDSTTVNIFTKHNQHHNMARTKQKFRKTPKKGAAEVVKSGDVATFGAKPAAPKRKKPLNTSTPDEKAFKCTLIVSKQCGNPVKEGHHWCEECLSPHFQGRGSGYAAIADPKKPKPVSCDRVLERPCGNTVKSEGADCGDHRSGGKAPRKCLA